MRALVLSFSIAAVVHGTSDAQRSPTLGGADRIRITEAFCLVDTLGDRLWPGGSSAPFAVLLVTPDRGFLVRHPKPTPDFVPIGGDAILGAPVWSRPRRFDVGLLASLPAVGEEPTIVIGQPEDTAAKTSTRRVLTLVHEHFHRLRYSRPDYYPGVNRLGLARGGRQGRWMLNYPFPYGKPEVQAQFARMCALLDEAIRQKRLSRPEMPAWRRASALRPTGCHAGLKACTTLNARERRGSAD